MNLMLTPKSRFVKKFVENVYMYVYNVQPSS